jgi:hypothetical protein
MFLTQNTAKLRKNLIITLVFKKNAHIFAENRQKSPKLAIITLTPRPRKLGLPCRQIFLLKMTRVDDDVTVGQDSNFNVERFFSPLAFYSYFISQQPQLYV